MSCLEQFSYTKNVKIIEKNVFSIFLKKSSILENSIIEYQNKTQDIAEEYFWIFGY